MIDCFAYRREYSTHIEASPAVGEVPENQTYAPMLSAQGRSSVSSLAYQRLPRHGT